MAGENSPAPRTEIHSGHPRVAFYGKCGSTRDAPLSLLRQLHAIATAMLDPTLISACFADIGVWNRRGDDTPRVLSLAGRRVHGGLVELPRQAHDPNRGFDVVACVDESRLPRRVSEHQAVLQEFAECGVRVATLITPVPQDFSTSPASSPHAWLFGVSEWPIEVQNLMRQLICSPTAGTRGDAR
jgi:hypothetical protein